MVKELSSLFRDNDYIQWPGESHHISCLAHVLNLAVQAFLKTLNITPMTEEEEWMLKDSDEDDDDDDDNACKYSQRDGTSTGRCHIPK
jgi:hypothetical protein